MFINFSILIPSSALHAQLQLPRSRFQDRDEFASQSA